MATDKLQMALRTGMLKDLAPDPESQELAIRVCRREITDKAEIFAIAKRCIVEANRRRDEYLQSQYRMRDMLSFVFEVPQTWIRHE